MTVAEKALPKGILSTIQISIASENLFNEHSGCMTEAEKALPSERYLLNILFLLFRSLQQKPVQ